MNEPLAIVFYEKLVPSGQLMQRLEEMGYRVKGVTDEDHLLSAAEQEKPLLAIVDLDRAGGDHCQLIDALKGKASTAHIPILAFTSRDEGDMLKRAQQAGAALVVGDQAIMHHLEQLLDQVLSLD